MFQFSIYVRHCASSENAAVHIKRVKSFYLNMVKLELYVSQTNSLEKLSYFMARKQVG